jgi:hypothetical protein
VVDVPRERSDLRATVMRSHGLLINSDKRIVGMILSVCIGDVFFYIMKIDCGWFTWSTTRWVVFWQTI